MGDKQPQQIEITFAPGAGEAVATFIRELVEQHATARALPAEPAKPATNPLDLGLELWSFHSPSAACDVVAYVDDHNQVRHVPTTRVGDVPRHWRRIWLEDRSGA